MAVATRKFHNVLDKRVIWVLDFKVLVYTQNGHKGGAEIVSHRLQVHISEALAQFSFLQKLETRDVCECKQLEVLLKTLHFCLLNADFFLAVKNGYSALINLILDHALNKA